MTRKSNAENCDLLFDYLGNILYDDSTPPLNLESLDEEFRELGEGLQLLQTFVKELKEYTADLSVGNLSGKFPSRDNYLCTNLKNLHANLNHLTWQAKQVAEGDYTQKVSYLGEFSESFNSMIHQLKEREALLKKESALLQKQAESMKEYNKFLIEMTCNRKEWIYVVDKKTKELVYCNKQENKEKFSRGNCQSCITGCVSILPALFEECITETYAQREMEADGNFYQVSTFFINWHELDAIAYVIDDITERKKASQKLETKAYKDAVTGIPNRLFMIEYYKKFVDEGKNGMFCYIDLDGLKFVNDNFGHNEGDAYLLGFVHYMKEKFRSSDILARLGGDEFCMILENITEEVCIEKMEKVRADYIEENQKEYPVSFSYGIMPIDNIRRALSWEIIVEQADQKMYYYKKEHKKNRVE